MGEVGGLGAQATYGHAALTWREFEAAWMIQQTILRLQAEQNEEAGGGSRSASVRRTIRLEKTGMLDGDVPERPEGLPLDPYDPNADPEAMRAAIEAQYASGIT